MPRAIWTGSITFGLVSIPIRLHTAVREHKVHFHQLAPDGSRVKYKRVSEKSGREVDYDKITRGFETSKGKFVEFEPGELEALAPAATKTIDIDDFVPLPDIDPIYFDRTYHLEPSGEGASHSYTLLAAVMDERERVGIGTIVIRERQHLAAVRPYGKGLALSTLHFADEIVDQRDIDGIPTRTASVSPKEKKLAVQILDSLETEWKPERYHDSYEEQLHDVIDAKKKGKVIEVEDEEPSAKVLDLMEALQASLDSAGGRKRAAGSSPKAATRTTKKPAKKPGKKQPAKKKAASRRRAS
jgi:DNA end-binding protein Ku